MLNFNRVFRKNKLSGKLFLLSFCLGLIVVILSVSTSTKSAPIEDPYSLQSTERPPRFKSGTEVLLLAGTTNSPSYVAPPQPFLSHAPETATIHVTYDGFSTEAQNAFQYAVDIWETQITSPVVIEVVAHWEVLGTGILGSAGPTQVFINFSNAPQSDSWYAVAIANKLAGYDIEPGNHDINASFNSSLGSWYFGTDGNPPAGTYDFVSVVLHELGHGLGFSGSMTVNNNQGIWGWNGNPIRTKLSNSSI